MDIKNYLSQYSAYKSNIMFLKAEIKDVDNELDDIAAESSGSVKEVDDKRIKYLKARKIDLLNECDGYYEIMNDICSILDKIKDPLLRQIARLHYLDGVPWCLVADAVGYSETSIYRMNRKITKLLDEISSVMQKKQKGKEVIDSDIT